MLQLAEGADLKLIAAWPAEYLEKLRQKVDRMPIQGKGVTTRAFRQNEAQLIPNVPRDPDFVDATDGQTGSVLAVVLQREGKPIGVLSIESREIGGLTENDKSLLIALADLVVAALHNVKQYKELQATNEKLEEAQGNLVAATTVAQMGLFGANWSHTVSQKVMAIRSKVALLKVICPDYNPKIDETLDEIDSIAQKIQAVKSVSPSETKSVLIDEFIRELTEKLCEPHEQIGLEVDLKCRDVYLKIDEARLEMAWQNLVENAIRHMPNGGRLTVRSVATPEKFVLITLQDTGTGISDEQKSFYGRRVIPKNLGASGSGTGALLAGYILRQFGGDLALVWSEKGKGTCLEIKLPIQA
jgi:signal transduction histidine kinase